MKIAPELASLLRHIADISPNPRNYRKHPEANLRAIEASLRAHGQQKPIVVREGVVVAGHGTLEAAKRLGWTEIACVEYQGSEKEALAYGVADNRPGDLADDDAGLLAEALRELEAEGLLDATGYDTAGLDEVLAAADAVVAESLSTSTSERPPKESKPREKREAIGAKSVRGEIYELGNHLLYCGDSTDLGSSVLSICEGVTHVFTDPPYGVDYQCHLDPALGKIRGRRIENDGSTADTALLVRCALEGVAPNLTAAFACCDWKSLEKIRQGMTFAGLEPKDCIVWKKTGGYQNLDLYARSHEFILYSGPYGGEKTQCTDVWEFPREFGVDHPTPKPVKMIIHALTTMPRECELADVVVYDPFAGSGSTLLAAEAVGCRSVLVEMDPIYCDVIRKRWGVYCQERDLDPGSGSL